MLDRRAPGRPVSTAPLPRSHRGHAAHRAQGPPWTPYIIVSWRRERGGSLGSAAVFTRADLRGLGCFRTPPPLVPFCCPCTSCIALRAAPLTARACHRSMSCARQWQWGEQKAQRHPRGPAHANAMLISLGADHPIMHSSVKARWVKGQYFAYRHCCFFSHFLHLHVILSLPLSISFVL